MANFASRIKELRQSNNLSQRKLAEKLGVSQVAVTHWENQSREPSISTIEKIAEFFHVTPAYMVGWDEEEERKQEEALKKAFPPTHSPFQLEPGEIMLDITRENYEKYPKCFELAFKMINDLEPAPQFNGFVIDTQSGRIVNPEELKNLTEQLTVDDNLELLKHINARMKYNPKSKFLTLQI